MNIPKKISPDNLKDTVIEIRYESQLSPELILGRVGALLGETYEYVPVAAGNIAVISPLGSEISVTGGKNIGFFTGHGIKIQIIDNKVIAFNCVGDYLGWAAYSGLIYSALEKLQEGNVIKSYKRINIRYISAFEGVDILQQVKGRIELGEITGRDEPVTLRIERETERGRSFIMLISNAKKKEGEGKGSLVDISVFRLFEGDDSGIFRDNLEKGHATQKELFFSLLKEDFIQTLNPEY